MLFQLSKKPRAIHVRVGGGGSVASASQQLNLNIGGTDTTGTSDSPSGAQYTPGFFASQTYE